MFSKRSTQVAKPTTVRRGVAVVVGASLVGAVAASPAAATFGAPFAPSGAGSTGQAVDPQVAVDADGDTIFAWRLGNGRVQARVRSTTGALSAVQNLSETGWNAGEPEVAVDAGGNAVFVWQAWDGTRSRVQTRSRSATGAWSAVQTLSAAGGDAGEAQVAVDANGNAVFAWTRYGIDNTYRLQTRMRSAAGVLSAVQTLSIKWHDAHEPQVAVDPNGNAVFVWQLSNDTTTRVQARARSAAGVLSAVQTLSAAGVVGANPRVGVDANGNAVFAWLRWLPFPGGNRIQARARSVTGTLSAAQILSESEAQSFNPQVAVDADGDAVVAWQRNGRYQRIQARSRSAAGAWSATQNISAAGQNGSSSRVGVDADGNTVFVWQRFDGTNYRLQARTRSAAGLLSAVQNVSESGEDASFPQLAVGAGGDAAAAWMTGPTGQDEIKAAFGP